MTIVGSNNKKHLRGSSPATIHPFAIILTAALGQYDGLGSIVALILPSPYFLYRMCTPLFFPLCIGKGTFYTFSI